MVWGSSNVDIGNKYTKRQLFIVYSLYSFNTLYIGIVKYKTRFTLINFKKLSLLPIRKKVCSYLPILVSLHYREHLVWLRELDFTTLSEQLDSTALSERNSAPISLHYQNSTPTSPHYRTQI